MKKIITLFAALAATSLVLKADAATMNVTAKFGDYKYGIQTLYFGAPTTLAAGTFTATLTGGPAGYPTTFDAYCVDLAHYTHGLWTVNLQSTDLLPNGKGVAWLYDHFDSGVTDLEHGAALQVAIWKVLTDNSTNLDAGNFQLVNTHDAFYTDVTTYLNAWNGTGQDQATWFQSASHPDGRYNQDMVGPNSVPEPGVLGLLASVMVSASSFAVRRRRK